MTTAERLRGTLSRLPSNTLFFGDNLHRIHKYLPDKCINLISVTSPFNSNRDHNLLFRE